MANHEHKGFTCHICVPPQAFPNAEELRVHQRLGHLR